MGMSWNIDHARVCGFWIYSFLWEMRTDFDSELECICVFVIRVYSLLSPSIKEWQRFDQCAVAMARWRLVYILRVSIAGNQNFRSLSEFDRGFFEHVGIGSQYSRCKNLSSLGFRIALRSLCFFLLPLPSRSERKIHCSFQFRLGRPCVVPHFLHFAHEACPSPN